MNKTISIILAFILSNLFTIRAESENCNGTICGKVVSTDGFPVEGAYIFVIDDISTQNIIASEFSDNEGRFTLNSPCGDRILGISCLGYKLERYNVSVNDTTIYNIGECRLSVSALELQTVIVKGSPIKVKSLPDGFSVNVSDLTESSNNALDLLSRLPQIKLKGDELKVIGKEKIILRVNNVIQRVSADQLSNVLRGYDAALINSVDVITSPSVKYDSEGTAAMIILHMDSKFNKYTGGNIGTELMKGSRYNGRYGVYGSFVFNNEKLFIDITPSYNHNYSHFTENATHKYDTGDSYVNNNPSRGYANYVGGYATLQYQYHKNGYLGFNCNLSKRNTDNDFTSEETLHNLSTYNHNSFEIKRPRINASVYAEQAITKSLHGWIEATYYNYSEKTDQMFDGTDEPDSTPFMSYVSLQELKSNGLTFSNDYSLQIGQEAKFNIDFGIKGYYARIHNSRDNELHKPDTPIAQQNDWLTLNETKITPYISATYRPVSSLFFRLGAQISNNHRTFCNTDLINCSLNYTNFLPDFIASWSPRSSSKLSFIITSGCLEPKFDQINPFEWRSNQYTYFRGNLDLKSESRYYYKTVYTYKGNLSISAYINQTKNQISSIGEVIDENLYYTTKNAQNSIEYGIRTAYYYDRLDWLELSAEMYWGYGVSKGIVPEIIQKETSNLWGGNLYGSFVFNRSRTLTGYINIDYTGRQRNALSTIDPMSDVGAGISWHIIKRRMNVFLSGINLFSSLYKGKSFREGYTTYFKNRYNFPTIYISITYKFNNLKDLSPRRQKSIKNIEQRM
jgi:hypothetical protein